MARDVARVSQKTLAKAVSKAVTLASRRHRLKFEPNLFERDVFEVPPFIFGRRVRDKADLDQAFKAAQTITEGVKVGGLDLQAVAMKVDGDILVGFIELNGVQLASFDIGF